MVWDKVAGPYAPDLPARRQRGEQAAAGGCGEQACGPRGQWVHRPPGGDLHGLTTCSSALAYRNQGGHPRGEEGSALPAGSWHPRGPVPMEARPKGEEFGFCQDAKVESPFWASVPPGDSWNHCVSSLLEEAQSGLGARKSAGRRLLGPGWSTAPLVAAGRGPECQTQRSEFIRKPSGATEGFSTGEGRGQLSLTGGRRLEGRPAWVAAGTCKEQGTGIQGRVEELQVQSPWGHSWLPLPARGSTHRLLVC